MGECGDSEQSAFRTLIRRADALDIEAVPQSTITHAVHVIADTIGVMVAGSSEPEVARLADNEGDPLGPSSHGPAQIATPGAPRMSPAAAAFINGTAASIVELDEWVLPGTHPGIHILPAALAAAQALSCSGGDLIAAVLSGYEVSVRLAQAYRLHPLVQPHGHLPAVGAAVAVARLRGQNAEKPAAIAAAMPVLTLWEPSFEGATVHYTYAGAASAIGIVANRLASAGFTGSGRALQIAFGEVIGEPDRPDVLEEPIEPEALMIDRNTLKLHSCCSSSYGAVAAALSLGPIDPSTVRAIHVEAEPAALMLARQPLANSLSARFSLQYAVAAAIVHGHAQPSAFEPDERSLTLARRITVRPASDLDGSGVEARAARVSVETTDGVRISDVNDGSVGFERQPVNGEVIRRKFERLVADPVDGRPRVSYDYLLELEKLTDLSDLLTSNRNEVRTD